METSTQSNATPKKSFKNWMSFLSVVIILLAIWYASDQRKQAKQNAIFIEAPLVGDVVEVKAKEEKYVLLKVVTVKSDSIFLRANNYQSNSVAGLGPLKDSTYLGDISYLSRVEYKKMFDKGEILEVDRKK
ncbi:MAG: hypothetical protein WCH78_10755 [Bacteroidota bacterium]